MTLCHAIARPTKKLPTRKPTKKRSVCYATAVCNCCCPAVALVFEAQFNQSTVALPDALHPHGDRPTKKLSPPPPSLVFPPPGPPPITDTPTTPPADSSGLKIAQLWGQCGESSVACCLWGDVCKRALSNGLSSSPRAQLWSGRCALGSGQREVANCSCSEPSRYRRQLGEPSLPGHECDVARHNMRRQHILPVPQRRLLVRRFADPFATQALPELICCNIISLSEVPLSFRRQCRP